MFESFSVLSLFVCLISFYVCPGPFVVESFSVFESFCVCSSPLVFESFVFEFFVFEFFWWLSPFVCVFGSFCV